MMYLLQVYRQVNLLRRVVNTEINAHPILGDGTRITEFETRLGGVSCVRLDAPEVGAWLTRQADGPHERPGMTGPGLTHL